MNDSSPGIGHNSPPEPLFVKATEALEAAEAWLKVEEIKDAETADKLNGFVSQLTETHKALDGQRLAEGRAFKVAQDAKYNDPLSLLSRAKDKLVALRRAWLQAEQRKVDAARAKAEADARAAEEAARKAEEAAANAKGAASLRAELEAEKAKEAAEKAAKAAAEAPVKATISGDFSPRSTGLRTTWHAEVTDLAAAFRHYGKDPILQRVIRDEITRIASNDARKAKDEGKAPPGIRFFSKTE